MPSRSRVLLKSLEHRVNWRRHRFRDFVRMQMVYADGGRPVVVYSMPKTASSAAYAALRQAQGVFALKSHTLRPEHWCLTKSDVHWERGWTGMWRDMWHSDHMVHHHIVGLERPCRFVSLVRDPIATNISAFVYFGNYWLADLPDRPKLVGMDPDLIEHHFFERYPHHITTDWFDLEPKPELGVDVFDSPFPWDRGHAVCARGSFEMLVLRVDLDDRAKSTAINDFLGTRHVRIRRSNTSDEHGIRTPIEVLKSRMHANPDYVNAMIDHRFTAHFWSPAEREAMRRRWLTPPAEPA